VRAVNPSVRVISVQRNSRFGHPPPMVVERYNVLGVHLFRTDEYAAISVRTDGQSVWVAPYIDEPALVSTPVIHRITKTLVRPSAEPR
jgi:beta-lactamase superfamily II metal-dependent hydrolase